MLPNLHEIVDRDRELSLIPRVGRSRCVVRSVVIFLVHVADGCKDDSSGSVGFRVRRLDDDVTGSTGVVDEKSW